MKVKVKDGFKFYFGWVLCKAIINSMYELVSYFTNPKCKKFYDNRIAYIKNRYVKKDEKKEESKKVKCGFAA